MITAETARQNRILALLSPADLQAVLPTLEHLTLEIRHVLEPRGGKPDHVHFPVDGVVSMTTLNESGDEIEVATIGYEGMAGISLFLGREDSALESYMQVPGAALRMARRIFEELCERRTVDRV